MKNYFTAKIANYAKTFLGFVAWMKCSGILAIYFFAFCAFFVVNRVLEGA